MSKKFNYRLGFDLGYTSLGWACILLNEDNHPCGVHDFGVRIFPSGRDDKSKAPTSVERREKRGTRRNRDRYLKRRQALLDMMITIGLQPDNKNARKQLAEREPLVLRAKGVSEKLTLHELGRALFHLNQRRGFKSNRIAERSGSEDESGLKKGISELAKQLADNQQTLGQYLFERLQRGQSTRLKAEDSAEERWTSRQMVENEFWTLLNQQQQYHADILTDVVTAQLHDIIFYQRNLKPQTAGLCTLIDDEKRARLAYPQTQLFRIYQEVNNLEIIKEPPDTPSITQAMRDKLVRVLSQDFSDVRKDGFLAWSKIEKIIGVKGVKFNLDTQGRKGLKADTTTRTMITEAPDWWQNLSLSQQREGIDAIQLAQTDEDLAERLQALDFQTSVETIEKLNKIHLDDGYGRISIKAIEAVMPYLQQGQIYSTACESAGYNHSDDYDGTVFFKGDLPFYGEVLPKQVIGGSYAPKDKTNPENYYGKINNPTVHMALNQFRLVLNELVKEYGCPPREIYLEMARETALSAKELGKLNSEQTKNRKENEEINKALEKLSVAQTYANRMKYKLWEDLDKDPTGRCCPLCERTDHPIKLSELFTPNYEIEHIIPFSRSFDDSRNNKMISCKSCNQLKGNQTPYEAFGNTPRWDNVLAKAKKMAKGTPHVRKFNVNKYWRFLPDAIEQMQIDGDSFIARQLNDTKYLSRMARRYAEFVTGKYPNERRVYAIKGKYTSDLRHHWGLDELVGDFKDGKFSKDRTNHHHHAIDAIVIALCDSSAIQKLAKANKNARIVESNKMYLDVPPPYGGFSTQPIKERLKTLVISHKLDHKNPEKARQRGGSIGQLHEDTNYGHIHENVYATRKVLSANNFSAKKNIEEIASRNIRDAVSELFSPFADSKGKLKTAHKKDYHNALEAYKNKNNVKKVRVHLPKDNLIPIHDNSGKAYRHVVGGNNFCAEIWVSDKGKKAGKWQCEVIRNFDVNQKGFVPQWRADNPTAMKVMRLQINDMVAIDREGERVICRVQKMAMSGQIILRYHNDSTTEKKTEISVAGSSLQKQNARKIFVSPTGKIYDPSHAKRPKWDK